MKIKVICVGKLKEKFWCDAVSEYGKRLGRYCKFDLIEVKDEPVPERFSPAEQLKAIDAEGERILKHLTDNAVVCTLEINGKALSSEAFAQKIAGYGLHGNGQITFIIGGSLGLSKKVLARSQWHLSFSPMTFPHQLFRVMLLEQIYRAFKINNNETYHK